MCNQLKDTTESCFMSYCTCSKRDIPAINYVMHIAHCKRNIVLCKECQEPVAISQQEEHFEEYHVKVFDFNHGAMT